MMDFNKPYNREQFLEFLETFLPDDFTEREEDVILDHARPSGITGAKILGKSDSLDLHVLEITHEREHDPRVALATDAFKILANHWIHQALVAFKSGNSENYRLSYLTITLDLNEKNKPVRHYSNARRYSFYLGQNAKVKTPQQQLVKKGRVKGAEDLLDRFSLEVVNKEFYLLIAKAFDALVERTDAPNLRLPSVSAESVNVYKDFAVRLIGRLMFCWFLKQKQTESGRLIPDEVLSLRAAEQTENYYHAVLEPLFFEVLNTHQNEREIKSDAFDQVPYLNGGLFSPQYDDFYELDRATYTSRHLNTLVINDQWFKDFFGLLETYNFTIDENTVFDQELSVDPEMLGRIFENLLAEINPETGSSERKRTGSFYTPRQIVEYMVDQSLQEYLVTKTGVGEGKIAALISYDQSDDLSHPLDAREKEKIVKAITTLKILDPACGSGAFPIGILQKIVYILQRVDPECELWVAEKLQAVPDLWKKKIQEYYASRPPNYIRKLDVIKSSIFGVDIQHIAVEVSRLRCFLTLVVESQIEDKLPNRGVEPLPNLDFKFVCANTLVALPAMQSNGLFDDHAGIQELQQIMSEYFSATNSKKEATKLKFLQSQKEIMKNAFSAFGGSTGELTQKLTGWDPFSNKSSSWFDPKWMFGLEEKFDVVIGNPPYLRIQGIQKSDSVLAEKYKKEFKSASGSFDLYVLFVEKGLDLLGEGGVLNYIMPDKWLNSSFGKGIRKLIGGGKHLERIITFKETQVFAASTYSSIAWFTRQPNEQIDFFEFPSEGNNQALEALASFRNMDVPFISISAENLGNDQWVFTDPLTERVLKRLYIQDIKIKDVFPSIFQGIATGMDDVFFVQSRVSTAGFERIYSKAAGGEHEIEEDMLRPLLKGDQIHRYQPITTINRVIFPYERGENGNLRLLRQIELQNNYPKTLEYLLQFERQLREREKASFDDDFWYRYSRNQGTSFGERKKLVGPYLSLGSQFSFDERGEFFTNTKCYSYVPKPAWEVHLLTVLGILNSKLIWFFIKNTSSVMRGGYRVYSSEYMRRLTFPPFVGPVVKTLNDLVSKRLSGGDQADMREVEEKIEEAVHRLYGLTDDEISLVQASL